MESYNVLTGVAGAAIKWGQFVKRNGAGEFIPCTVAGEKFDGVSVRGDHEIGDPEVMVVVTGNANVGCADATVKRGDSIMTGTTGFAVKATGVGAYVARALADGRAVGPGAAGGQIRIPCAIPTIQTATTA